MEKKKMLLRFRDKPIGCLDSFVVDQDDNLIATLLREADMKGYMITFHYDTSVEPFYNSCLPEAMSIIKNLMRERGFELNQF